MTYFAKIEGADGNCLAINPDRVDFVSEAVIDLAGEKTEVTVIRLSSGVTAYTRLSLDETLDTLAGCVR